MICEDPCIYCGTPLTVIEHGEKSSLTYVDEFGMRRCLSCNKAIALESIDRVNDELIAAQMRAEM